MTIQNNNTKELTNGVANSTRHLVECQTLIESTISEIEIVEQKLKRSRKPARKEAFVAQLDALNLKLDEAQSREPDLQVELQCANEALAKANAKAKAEKIAADVAKKSKSIKDLGKAILPVVGESDAVMQKDTYTILLHNAHVKAYKDATDCLADSDTNEFERVNAKDSECKLFAEHVDMQNATDEQVNSDFQSLLKDLRSSDKKGRGPLASWLSLLYRKSVFADGTLTRRDRDLAVILKLLRDRTPYRIKIQKKDKTHTDGTVSRLAYVKITYKPEVTDKNVTEFWKPIPTKYWEKAESLSAGKSRDGEVKPFESTDEMLKAVTKVSDKIDGNKAMALDASYNMLEQNGVLNHFPELRKALEAVQAQKFQEDSQSAENTKHYTQH